MYISKYFQVQPKDNTPPVQQQTQQSNKNEIEAEIDSETANESNTNSDDNDIYLTDITIIMSNLPQTAPKSTKTISKTKNISQTEPKQSKTVLAGCI